MYFKTSDNVEKESTTLDPVAQLSMTKPVIHHDPCGLRSCVGHEYLRHFIKEQTNILGHNLNSNAIIMTERSVEKSNHVNFDDVKAACAVLMSVDAKISQAKNLHQRLLLTKLKEKSEITMSEFEERALNRGTENSR